MKKLKIDDDEYFEEIPDDDFLPLDFSSRSVYEPDFDEIEQKRLLEEQELDRIFRKLLK